MYISAAVFLHNPTTWHAKIALLS